MTASCERGDILWREGFRYRRSNGSYSTVDGHGTIIRNAEGKTVRFVGAMRVVG
jgi:hypothetical protein